MEVPMSDLRRFVMVPAAMIVVSGLVGAAAGCSGSGSAAGGSSGQGGGIASKAPVARAADGGSGGVLGVAEPYDSATLAPDQATQAKSSGGASGAFSEPIKLGAVPSAVIKTATVGLRVDHGQFGKSVQAIRRIADDLGGYDTRSATSGSKIHEGRMTISVPERSFRRATSTSPPRA
jgi:hypothetical protein